MKAPLRMTLKDPQAEFFHARFLAMLPQIHRQATVALRGLRSEVRQELTQEVVANAYCAFVRLVRRGKAAVAYPTPLAQYALRQIRAARRVGCQLNINDILSAYSRRVRGLTIERIDRRDARTGMWNQLLVEDRQAGPAETAAARLDIREWFSRLSLRDRRIAATLAAGESTSAVSRKFGLSAGRISQLRSRFRENWERFQSGAQFGSGSV